MARVCQLCLVLLLALGWQSTSANPFAIVMGLYDLSTKAYDSYQTLSKLVGLKSPKEEQLGLAVLEISARIKSINDQNNNLFDELMTKLLKELGTEFRKKITDLFHAVDKIDFQYQKFLDYSQWETTNPYNPLENETLIKYAEDVVSSSLSELSTYEESLYIEFLEDSYNFRTSIVTYLAQHTYRYALCTNYQTPYQMIVDLYTIITEAHTHAMVTKLFAYEILQNKRTNTPKYKGEVALEKRNFDKKVRAAYKKVKEALSTASRVLYSCNLANLEPNAYSKLHRVFQKHIIYNDEDKSDRLRCNIRRCSEYSFSKQSYFQRNCTSFCESEPKEKRCDGKFTECTHLPGQINACLADSSSDRYYDWITTDKANYGVSTESCENKKRSFKNQWRENYWDIALGNPFISQCNYCLCTCLYEDTNVNRYFSLDRVLSDYDDNKVITGVRLRLIDHVYYIQIKQGVLKPYGTIANHTNEWKEIENKVEDFSNIYERNRKVFAINDDQRTVYLDDIEPASDTPIVVTGIKFSQVDQSLRLEIEVSQFNYETGKLHGRTTWKTSGNRFLKKRKELLLNNPVVPLNKINRDLSQSGQYVQFKVTDLNLDVGQNTVPFIDLQQLETIPPVPLAGAGLFLRYSEGSGGFLGLKLFQYNDVPNL